MDWSVIINVGIVSYRYAKKSDVVYAFCKCIWMDDKLKADISKIVNEAVSSRLSNQQATLTFNLENIECKEIEYWKYVQE